MTGLLGPDSESTTHNVLVDLLGYDGWPAMWALGQAAAGNCGTKPFGPINN